MATSIEKTYVESEYDPIYDPFTAEFQADPFAAYARLRAEAPVYYNEKWGFYALSRFDDVRAALRDHESLLNFEGVDIDDFEQEQSGFPGMLPNIDNPRHDQLRKAVQRSFMPRSMRALTNEVRSACDKLLDSLSDRTAVDLSEEYSWPIPFEVFYNFLGMPEGDIREKFVRWTHGIKDRKLGTTELTEFARESSRELREYLAFLLRERREHPRDDVLTSIVQAQIDGEPLAPEDIDYAAEATGLAFALYLGGVETTAGTMSTLFEQLARHPEQLRALHDDPSLIPRAVEESLRYRTIFQVTARTAARDIEINGVAIPKGRRVFLILGSANRDETQFENAEEFDILRAPKPHLGFGEGLHGCLGNPLARLETTVALEQLVARRGMFALGGEPARYITTPNAYVLDHVPVEFEEVERVEPPRHPRAGEAVVDPGSSALDETAAAGAPEPEQGPVGVGGVDGVDAVGAVDGADAVDADDPEDTAAQTRRVRVVDRVQAADDVILLKLVAEDWGPLPAWRPGAHVDVVLGNGLERQYSLCGDPSDRLSYTIGVLREDEGRGGSRYIHESAHFGTALTIRGPRNHFELEDADRYLFIAGGIGITPIAAMTREAERAGKPWRLVYTGRSGSTMALRDEFAALGERVVIWPKDERGRLDLGEVLASPEAGTAVYFCGPDRLREGIEQICEESWPEGALRLERFTPLHIDESTNTEFEIELARSGYRLTVPREKSVLDTLEEAGVHVLSSCGEGTCGTCETPVLAGEIEHRDTVLSKAEQAANDCMMVCVSRANCSRLTLDL
ncbi:MAG: cytochrome P450 [Leucobacter sp.]